jgi:hypothetical protein
MECKARLTDLPECHSLPTVDLTKGLMCGKAQPSCVRKDSAAELTRLYRALRDGDVSAIPPIIEQLRLREARGKVYEEAQEQRAASQEGERLKRSKALEDYKRMGRHRALEEYVQLHRAASGAGGGSPGPEWTLFLRRFFV